MTGKNDRPQLKGSYMNHINKNSFNLREIVALISTKTNHQPRVNGANFLVRCPAHDDKSPSLSVGEGSDGKILLRCFKGCSVSEICSALDIKVRNLFPRKN